MHRITLPQAEQEMRDGTVVRWCVRAGESVTKDQVLAEVQTQRSLVRVLAEGPGTVAEILADAGTTVAVGAPLARIAEAGDATADVPQASATPSKGSAGPADTPPAGAGGPVTPVLMPKAGNTMEEGTIIAWRAAQGDTIKKGDVIFKVETDKAAVEVEATDAGRLARIVAAAGDTVEILKPVAYLADDDADVDAYLADHGSAAPAPGPAPANLPTADTAPAAPASGPAVAVATATGRVKASPAARKLAVQRGIDLAALPAGKGPQGRILSTDLPQQAPAVAAAPPKIVQGQPTRRPMSPMRKAIARNLLASKQNIPHFYMELTVDASPMLAFYREQKAKYPCSVNDVVVAACAKAVAEFPAFRSRLDGSELVEFPTANIGVAVGMDDGLVVPVLIAADQMTLQQTAAETRRIVDGARGGKVEGMGRGVLTISNLGMFGVHRFSAIINPPEAAILAVGTAREEAIVADGALRPGRVMTVTLSCDHRVIDGLTAAQFLARLKEILEAPHVLPAS